MKFNIGCGWRDFGEGWIHIDGGNYNHLDSSDIFLKDYDNNSANLIYASHFIEYFDRDEIIALLNRWKEVLGPSGILRLAVPDFEVMVKLYFNDEYSLENFLGPLYGKMEMGNTSIYHKMTYDFNSLKLLLEKVGMRNIKRYDWISVEHSQFDDHSQAYLPHMDKKNGTLISLNVECIK
jgi:predicted SAM-dependent methyltransferase|tara:strand:+ start:373 stop:909 length:537 start_codon:yes stop_codon:yes gene_type:complete